MDDTQEPPVVIKPATLRDMTYVASNAREIDKKEVLASGPSSMAEAAIVTWHLTEKIGGVAYCAWKDGNPEMVTGFLRQSSMTPWLFSAWMWGSELTQYCIPAFARYTRENLWPVLIGELGATRVEARSHIDHKCAHRFLKWTGFERETDLIDWGRDRARFVLFALRLTDWEEGKSKDVRRWRIPEKQTDTQESLTDVLRRRRPTANSTPTTVEGLAGKSQSRGNGAAEIA